MKTLKLLILTCSLITAANGMAYNPDDDAWGIKNTERHKTINTFVNPKQTYNLQGRIGEDINLPPRISGGRKVKVAVLDTGFDFRHSYLSQYLFKNTTEKCLAYEKLNKCIQDIEPYQDSCREKYKACVGESNGDKAKKKVCSETFTTCQKDVSVEKCRTNNLQAEKNVYPADCKGWSILDANISKTPNNIIGRPDFEDPIGHGTHVTGIITSVSKNVEIIPVQVIAVGPNQPMMPFSTDADMDLSPSEDLRNGFKSEQLSERISRGIIYAIESGAEVINMSIGWSENANTEIFKAAVKKAIDKGIIVVAAAGNDSTSSLLRPCQFKGVICVAAHGPDGALASFSNFGYGVDIAAPGVEIVSTYPVNKRSRRLPGIVGYEKMSGTSQAAPFVTGAIAEMLSRGIPREEIYPRLILGARRVQDPLPVLVGPVEMRRVAVNAAPSYDRAILSGLLDIASSVSATPRPLVLPADKEENQIVWDRKSPLLEFKFRLKNYWKSTTGVPVQISVTPNDNAKGTKPAVISVAPNTRTDNWAQNDEREITVKLRIADTDNPSMSRMPSELSYWVDVNMHGYGSRRFLVNATVIVHVNPELDSEDIQKIEFNTALARGQKLTQVTDIMDGNYAQRDYFITTADEKKLIVGIALVKQNENSYAVGPMQEFKFDGVLKGARPRYRMRLDMDGDGRSEYIYGLIEYKDQNSGINGDYRQHFYIFDSDMKLIKYFKYDDRRVAMPITFYWVKVKGQMRPAWVSLGQEVVTKWDVLDLASTEGSAEDVANTIRTKRDIYFYYLDENYNLAQVKPQDPEEKIVDVIQGTPESIKRGELTVLMARNLGDGVNPSYYNDFSLGVITNGEIISKTNLKQLSQGIPYRNLVDTFAAKALSLNSESAQFRGTMWYGAESDERQRVTMFDPVTQTISDKLIRSQRRIFDAPLLVRAGFQSGNRRGAFIVTNSEMEFHNLLNNEVVSTSLNRYTFLGDSARYVSFYFPLAISDRRKPGHMLPALFTTEGSGFATGMRTIVPVYDENDRLVEMVVPARLRLKTETGCKSLEDPVFLGENKGYAMDYQCGAKIFRIPLAY